MFTVVSLFILALLTHFSVSQTEAGRDHLKTAEIKLAKTHASYLAESGVAQAMAVLAADTTRAVDSPTESWADSRDAFELQSLASGCFSVRYHPHPSLRDTVYGLVDEERKINILRASPSTLHRLPDLPPELVRAVSEFRTSLERESRAHESDDTREPLRTPTLAELASAAQLSHEVYEEAVRTVTTYGAGKVNINTADPATLRSLGLSHGLVRRIERFRDGPDNVRGTEDDGIFTSIRDLATELRPLGPLSPTESAEIANLESGDVLTVSSQYFRVRSVGTDARRMARTVVETVLKRPSTGPAEIVEWYES